MAEGWFEVRIVLRTSEERIDQARSWLEDMGLAEVHRVDVIALEDDMRRWDGGRPPGVVADSLSHAHPTMDGLRRGLHLHEQ